MDSSINGGAKTVSIEAESISVEAKTVSVAAKSNSVEPKTISVEAKMICAAAQKCEKTLKMESNAFLAFFKGSEWIVS